MNGRYRGEGGGGVQMGILGGVCRPVLQILTVFETKKKIIFFSLFQTWPLKNCAINT